MPNKKHLASNTIFQAECRIQVSKLTSPPISSKPDLRLGSLRSLSCPRAEPKFTLSYLDELNGQINTICDSRACTRRDVRARALRQWKAQWTCCGHPNSIQKCN
jgi:hypothetical protein